MPRVGRRRVATSGNRRFISLRRSALGDGIRVALEVCSSGFSRDDRLKAEPTNRSLGDVAVRQGRFQIGNAGIGVVFGLLIFVVIMLGVLLVIPAIGSHSAVAIGIVIALIVLAVILLALVQTALQGIYAAAIYRYAEEGATSPGFDRVLITNAFQPKQDDGIFRSR